MSYSTSKLCENICVPYDENGLECEPKDYDNNCFTDTPYRDFYNAINWDYLHSNKQLIMNGFSDLLTLNLIEHENNNYFDPDLKVLFESVYNQIPAFGERDFNNLKKYVDNFPEVNPSRSQSLSPPLDYFKPTDIATLNQFCNDINFHFSVKCAGAGTGTRSRDLRIFHIAIHSARSKIYEIENNGIQLRSESNRACGWYQRAPGDTIGPGAFHYKIDNVKDRISESANNCMALSQDKTPYKRLIHSSDGRFENMDPNEQFQNLINEGTCAEMLTQIIDQLTSTRDKEKKKKATSKKRKYKDGVVNQVFLETEVQSLHRIICNLFIDFWNRKVQPYVQSVALPAAVPMDQESPVPGSVNGSVDADRMVLGDYGGNKNKLKRRKTKKRKSIINKTRRRRRSKKRTRRRRQRKRGV